MANKQGAQIAPITASANLLGTRGRRGQTDNGSRARQGQLKSGLFRRDGCSRWSRPVFAICGARSNSRLLRGIGKRAQTLQVPPVARRSTFDVIFGPLCPVLPPSFGLLFSGPALHGHVGGALPLRNAHDVTTSATLVGFASSHSNARVLPVGTLHRVEFFF